MQVEASAALFSCFEQIKGLHSIFNAARPQVAITKTQNSHNFNFLLDGGSTIYADRERHIDIELERLTLEHTEAIKMLHVIPWSL